MKQIINILLLVFTLIILYPGCDDTIVNNDIDQIDIPDSDVSYSKHIAPVFNVKCVPCHNSSTAEGGLDLSVWTKFVDGYHVVPSSPETSVLVWSIDPKYGYELMPPVGTPYEPLTPDQVQGVITWIEEGAENN